MKYAAIAFVSVAVVGVVGYALWLTKNPNVLWALLFMPCLWTGWSDKGDSEDH